MNPALLCLVLLGTDGDATTRARAHFEAAEGQFQLGRFESALTEYEAAYEAKPLPALLSNIAQCHRNLKHHDRAIYFLEQYLEQAPEAKNRTSVERLIQELRVERDAELARAAPPPPPFYERGWFWTAAAVVAVAAAGAVWLGTSGSNVPDGLGDPIRVP